MERYKTGHHVHKTPSKSKGTVVQRTSRPSLTIDYGVLVLKPTLHQDSAEEVYKHKTFWGLDSSAKPSLYNYEVVTKELEARPPNKGLLFSALAMPSLASCYGGLILKATPCSFKVRPDSYTGCPVYVAIETHNKTL